MSWRMHIAVVDCITTHPTRHLPAFFYTDPLPKKEINRDFGPNGEWPRYNEDEEEVDRTAFNNFVTHDFGLKEDYCLGCLPIPKDIGKPFYANEETQKLFEYYNPRVLDKEDFKKIIDLMRKEVADYYYEQLQHRNNPLVWQGMLEARMELWEAPYIEPYNLEDNQKEIVRAHNLEYRIFDLVRLYKTVDWMRDTVIFFGW